MNLADVIVSDADEVVPGNPENKADESTPTKATASPATAANDADVPEKFRGKTPKELVEMYLNLESVHGRTANDLGVQRQLTDRLLDLKRSTDLQANSPPAPAKKVVPVTANDILDRPQETLERVIDEKVNERVADVHKRLANAEAALAHQTFAARHPDYNSVTQDPVFVEWVKAKPLRLRAAAAANAGNWQVADELLSEFKDSQGGTRRTDPAPAAATADLDGARRASLTTTGSASGTDGKSNGGKKTYRRSALMKMRIEDPEAYYDEGFQAELLQAHAEKRVI